MKNNTSTAMSPGAKIRFIDFMQLSITARKAHIEKYSPDMSDSQKRAVLN